MKKLAVVICSLMIIFGGVAMAQADTLYPVREGRKWGYINAAGKMVIAPQFAYANFFRNGYAIVNTSTDMGSEAEGIIDLNGRYVVEPNWFCYEMQDGYYYGGFDTGVIGVKSFNHGEAGFFDLQSGTLHISADWDEIDIYIPPDARLIGVYIDRQIAYVDRFSGAMVVPPQKNASIGHFNEGFAVMAVNDENGSGPQYFILDESGNITPLPEQVEPGDITNIGFSDGLAAVYAKDSALMGYIDTTGTLVIPAMFDFVWDFSEGLACVDSGYLSGYIDRQGNWVIAPIFISGYNPEFHDGLAVIGAQSTVIDRLGKVQFEMPKNEYIDIFSYQEGVFFYFCDKQDGIGMIDRKGKVLLSPDAGLCMDDSGNVYIDGQYFSEGLAVMMKLIDGVWQYGYVNLAGQITIPLIWDKAYSFMNGLACVEKGGKMCYIDHTGQIVWQEK